MRRVLQTKSGAPERTPSPRSPADRGEVVAERAAILGAKRRRARSDLFELFEAVKRIQYPGLVLNESFYLLQRLTSKQTMKYSYYV